MKSILISGFAFGALASEDWESFKTTFGKSYENREVEAYRKGIFETNLQFISQQNSQQSEYTLGVNQFADLLTQEWSSQYFGMAKPATSYGDAPYLGRHVASNATLPTSVDWSQKGAVTPIKNQGQCGSCWAFSSTGSLEGANAIATGKLVSLSEQQLVDCTKAEGEQGCNGGLMDGAFKYAEKTAICTEDSYSYQAKSSECQASSCTTGLAVGAVTGFKDVATDSKNDLMSAVAQQPVSIAIEADKQVFQLYRDGVLSGMCGAQLDHGVLVVGYGTESNGGDYWKVKNSWGPSWGAEGYILLKRGKVGAQAGECGILTAPSYPVIKKTSEEIIV